MKKLSIIIPAYNEERSISQILGKIHQTRLIGETEKEILIIDDGSKDSTAEKCRQFMQAHPDLDIHYHLQPFNQGKGAALRTGIALVLRLQHFWLAAQNTNSCRQVVSRFDFRFNQTAEKR